MADDIPVYAWVIPAALLVFLAWMLFASVISRRRVILYMRAWRAQGGTWVDARTIASGAGVTYGWLYVVLGDLTDEGCVERRVASMADGRMVWWRATDRIEAVND